MLFKIFFTVNSLLVMLFIQFSLNTTNVGVSEVYHQGSNKGNPPTALNAKHYQTD